VPRAGLYSMHDAGQRPVGAMELWSLAVGAGQSVWHSSSIESTALWILWN